MRAQRLLGAVEQSGGYRYLSNWSLQSFEDIEHINWTDSKHREYWQMSYRGFFAVWRVGNNTKQHHFLFDAESQSESQKRTKQNIHIFKLDLQHLTDSSMCVESDRDLFTPLLLCIICECLSKLTKEGPLCIFGSMLIARNNIKDVRFLCLSILHYNKFRNITREHSLLRSSKVEPGWR